MKFRPFALAVLATLAGGLSSWAQASDARQVISMPLPMREHMLANMRDHLSALSEIQLALAAGRYEEAADIAEQRIGMSSLERHGASHMAPYMPKAMQDIGTNMHRAASRFARAAHEATVTRDTASAIGALAEVTQQCVACHVSFRLK